MAKSNRNTAQSSNSGFWETYEADIPQPFSEYKKPSCQDYVPGTKKKSNSKKHKPAPALAAVMFSSGVEETAKKRYAQPEPLSGPSAWSMRPGAALFREPPPDERRSSRYHEPYYPPPQSELLDEDEMMRKAIEESMKTAQEEQERKRRQEKEEEEWLSKVVKDLIKEDKSSGNVKMSEARKKVTRKYSGDSTDSEDFLTSSSGKCKTGKVGGTASKKQVDSIQKTNEKSMNKPELKKSNFSQMSSEMNTKEKHERDPFKELRPEKQDKSRHVKEFSSNLYDDYDDDGSELDETDCLPSRSTFWPSRNESHKWNAETWGGGRAELPDTRTKLAHNEPKAQRTRSFLEELPDTRNYKQDAPKHNRNRESMNEMPDTRYEAKSRARSYKEDSQGSTTGSPAKSRNFKLDFFNNQSEEIEKDIAENKKHVKFATAQSTYVISNSGTETDSSHTDVFASNKSNFDVSLYSNNDQKSKGLPTPNCREVKPSDTRRRNEKPAAMSVPKSSVARNTWKEALQTSDEKENNRSSNKQSSSDSKKEKVNSFEKSKVEREEKKLNVRHRGALRSSNSGEKYPSNDLGPSLSDMKLDDLPPRADLPVNIKASVLDEIKAEVKLPQDNNIYNFYHNKQLGIQTKQDHLITEGHGFGFTELSKLSPPANSFDVFMENWSSQRETTSIPQSTTNSEDYHPFAPCSLPSTTNGFTFPTFTAHTPRPYDYYPMQQPSVPQTSYPTSTLPGSQCSTSDLSNPTELRATSTPVPPISPPVAPRSDSLPYPHMASSNTPSSTTSTETNSSRQMWRQLLLQAENDPVMLSYLNVLLKRSIDTCSNTEELNTLLSFVMEVDAAVKRYNEKNQASNNEASADANTSAGVAGFENEERGTGRGRGKRGETRDHVNPTLGNAYPTPGNAYHNPTPGNDYHNPAPSNVYHNPTPGNVYPNPTPSNVYHNPTPGNDYPNPTPSNVYHNPTPGNDYHNPAPSNVYHNPTPGNEYHNHTPGNAYPNPAPGNAYPNPTPGNVYPNPTPGNAYPNPTPGNAYPNPAPGNAYPNPTPGNVYPNPTPGNAYPNPTPGNAYPNPTPGNAYPNPTFGNDYPNPTPGNAYPNPVPGNAYPNPIHGNVYHNHPYSFPNLTPGNAHSIPNPYFYSFPNHVSGQGLTGSIPGDSFPNTPGNIPIHALPNPPGQNLSNPSVKPLKNPVP